LTLYVTLRPFKLKFHCRIIKVSHFDEAFESCSAFLATSLTSRHN